MKFLILPCNKYAKDGDYLKSKAWKKAKQEFPEYKLVAVDSIITIKDPMNDKEKLGALVLYPEEMYRVKGHDEYPSWEKFKKKDFELLWKHAKYVEIGLKRIIKSAERIIVIQNVRAYKLAIYWALKRVYGGIPKHVLFIDVPERPWALEKGIKLASKIKNYDGGLYKLRWKYDRDFPEDIPEEFKYWKYEKIIWVEL